MQNILRSTTDTALLFLRQYVYPGATVVDATCGNGYDTVALAEMGAGKIYGFDIQKEAIRRTGERLRQKGFPEPNILDIEPEVGAGAPQISETSDREPAAPEITLIADSHSKINAYIREPICAAVMNLGYLPDGDKQIITQAGTTVEAIRQILERLEKDGLLCITLYSGHPGGSAEKQEVLRFAEQLDKRCYHAAYLRFVNQPGAPPEILLITAKAGSGKTG